MAKLDRGAAIGSEQPIQRGREGALRNRGSRIVRDKRLELEDGARRSLGPLQRPENEAHRLALAQRRAKLGTLSY